MPVVVLKEYQRNSEALANLFVLIGWLSFTTVVSNKLHYVLNHIGDISFILHIFHSFASLQHSHLYPLIMTLAL